MVSNIFASGWVLRSAGLKGNGHGGSGATASNARRVLIPSGHDLVCFVEPLPFTLTQQNLPVDYTFRSADRATVFGLFLARGGHQTMKRSISI